MLSALQRKLFRDLWHMRGQVTTIALVIACGIASYIALQGTYASLIAARDRFYERQRFGEVFVELERAPRTLEAELARVPGVERIDTRVVANAVLPIATVSEPIRARIISLPENDGATAMNVVRLIDGRVPEPDHADEVLLLEGFASAHSLEPHERIPAIINGKKRNLMIVGTVRSPDFVMATPPNALSADPERFAVLWMNEQALAAAFQMEGAFNHVSFGLGPDGSETAVIAAVDRLLEPYGGFGAYGRARQASNAMLNGELVQLESISTILPLIFLAVAALLVNVVLSRLVQLQQPEIATLKAIGYSNTSVGLHFLELVLVVAFLGGFTGIALGSWLGAELIEVYERYFKFPDLSFELAPRHAGFAFSVTFIAATFGAFFAVRRAVRLPPAEAMRPPAPTRYRRSLIDRLKLAQLVGPSLQMIVRELERRPVRALLSILAIATSTGLTVIGGWYFDGIRALVDTQFRTAMREDAAVTFMDPQPERSVRALEHVEGVLYAEGLRMVPVRFRSEHRTRQGALWGYPDHGELRKLRTRYGQSVALPPNGIVLTDVLANILHLKVGDPVEIDLLEGKRGIRRLQLVGLVDEPFGLQGHMRLPALREWLAEPPLVSMALLRTDPAQQATVDQRLKDMPVVVDVTRRATLLRRFEEQSASMIMTMATIVSLFAAVITVAVVYNNARIALAMRARDLASLRVLGFTRAEVSGVLLGEIAILVLLALPLGLLFGHWLVNALAQAVDPETYRLPVLLTPRTYAFAALVTVSAAFVSALLVRRRIDRLDLVSVLKTRE